MLASSLKFLVLSLIIGLAWGWSLFAGSGAAPADAIGTARWVTPVLPEDYSTSAGRFEQEMLQPGFLARPVSALEKEAEDNAPPPDGLSGLQFLSAARINNALIVQIRLPDGRVSSVRTGDAVLDGWIVASTTPYSILLKRAGEERVFGSRLKD